MDGNAAPVAEYNMIVLAVVSIAADAAPDILVRQLKDGALVLVLVVQSRIGIGIHDNSVRGSIVGVGGQCGIAISRLGSGSGSAAQERLSTMTQEIEWLVGRNKVALGWWVELALVRTQMRVRMESREREREREK